MNTIRSMRFTWTFILIGCMATAASAAVTLDREAIQVERGEDVLIIQLPFLQDGEERIMDDLSVTLMKADDYTPLAKLRKKVVLLNGRHVEEAALPIAPDAPPLERCILRVDLGERIWLKRFTPPLENGVELMVVGQREWLAESQAVLRVLVTNSSNGQPISGAKTRLLLQPDDGREPILLADALSDENGEAALVFTPRETITGEHGIRITVEAPQGRNEVSAQATIRRAAKVFLTTDKPVYQPNQVIHIRALAANAASGKPLDNREVTLEVFDGKNNKVFRKVETTSEFGIVSTDFQLADEVNQGEYRIQAILDDVRSVKTAQVYEYVLPKFRIDIKTEESFYAPGQTIEGSVNARYFFGQPVSGAKVSVVANAFDVGFHEFARHEGEADDEGRFEFALEIPERLVGQPLFQGDTMIQLEVEVTDSADQQEERTHSVHASVKPLRVEVIPEAGALRAGVENEVFLVASRPDGSVARPVATIHSEQLDEEITVPFDENGVGSFFHTPKSDERFVFTLEAEIDDERVALGEFTPDASSDADALLLRPDKAVYRVGDTLRATIFAPQGRHQRAFVDVIKEGQTMRTESLDLSAGRAELALPIDNSLAGTLTLSAYQIRGDGNIIRSNRRVVALRNDDLRIEISADREQYEPGQPIPLRIAVRGEDGEPVRAALGMHVVDESVYSLTEKAPGLMKVFFAIEEELLQPRVQINAWTIDRIVPVSVQPLEEDQRAAKALFARLDSINLGHSLSIDTTAEKRRQVERDLQQLQRAIIGKRLKVSAGARSVEELLLESGHGLGGAPALDPWNRPYHFYAKDEDFWLASAGADGRPGTDHDVRIPAFQYSRYEVFDADGEAISREKLRGRFASLSRRLDRGGIVVQGDGIIITFNQPAPRMARPLDGRWQRQQAEPGINVEMMQELRGLGYMGGGMGVREEAEAVDGMAMMGMGMAGAPDAVNGAGGFYGMGMGGMEMAGQPMASQNVFFDRELSMEGFADHSENAQADLFYFTQEALGLDPDAQEPMAFGDIESLRKAAELHLQREVGDLSEEAIALLEGIRDRLEELEEGLPAPADTSRAVRVRRYFPETLYYTPELITDDRGEIALTLPAADSITTWRLSAMANALSGAVGDATAALPVFKPFFVDLNLPTHLTQNDEVTIPVAIYNYLERPQEVEVQLERAGWFDLLEGSHDRTVQLAAGEVASVTYRIRANALGRQPITVYAWGADDADAIGRSIEVRPDGDQKHVNFNGRLTGSVRERINLPTGRVEGADRLFVRIFPGVFSQVVEGMDSLLRMPHGCFEQTSSINYPNLLTLRYMRDAGRITPEVEMRALEYINLGWQRLLTFEIAGGGFSVFGNPPANRVLSAYGLMQFTDLDAVYDIDERVLERTRRWLLDQRNADGSWTPDDNYAHAEMWKSIQDNNLLVTAYVALALAHAGERDSLATTRDYLLRHAGQAEDAYTLSILCNTLLRLAPNDAATRDALRRLLDLAQRDGDLLYWESEASLSFARGNHASVETTAWAALALIESGRHHRELDQALNWLIDQRSPHGAWETTHGTVLALKALIGSLGARTESADGTIAIRVDGEEAETLRVTPETSDLFRQVELTTHLGGDSHQIEIEFIGENGAEPQGRLLYQVVGRYYEPWKTQLPATEDFTIAVEYDRTELRRNDTVTCRITARNNRLERAEMVMIDVGVPPGFRVERDELDRYVEQGVIAKHTIMSRQLLIYLESLQGGQELNLEVTMRATLPMVALAPESTVYEYYNPEVRAFAPPRQLVVE